MARRALAVLLLAASMALAPFSNLIAEEFPFVEDVIDLIEEPIELIEVPETPPEEDTLEDATEIEPEETVVEEEVPVLIVEETASSTEATTTPEEIIVEPVVTMMSEEVASFAAFLAPPDPATGLALTIASNGDVPEVSVACAGTDATMYLGHVEDASYIAGVIERVPCVDEVATFSAFNLNDWLLENKSSGWPAYVRPPLYYVIKNTTGLDAPTDPATGEPNYRQVRNLSGAFNGYRHDAYFIADTTWPTLAAGPAFTTSDNATWLNSANGDGSLNIEIEPPEEPEPEPIPVETETPTPNPTEEPDESDPAPETEEIEETPTSPEVVEEIAAEEQEDVSRNSENKSRSFVRQVQEVKKPEVLQNEPIHTSVQFLLPRPTPLPIIAEVTIPEIDFFEQPEVPQIEALENKNGKEEILEITNQTASVYNAIDIPSQSWLQAFFSSFFQMLATTISNAMSLLS